MKSLVAKLAMSGCFLAALPAAALAAPQSTRELDDALARMAERGELRHGSAAQTIQQPARLRYGLGAVVDVRQASRSGLPVLAVTPDGAGDRMGLRSGDRILAINGRRLDGQRAPANLLQPAVDAGNGRLRVAVARDGQQVQLQGSADVVSIPAYRITVAHAGGSGCGYVSDTGSGAPRQGVYSASIRSIDGRSLPSSVSDDAAPRHRVNAGKRLLVVSENLPQSMFMWESPISQARARSTKPLIIDIQPGMRYEVGARQRVQRISRQDLSSGDYWEPVVYARRAEACR